MKMRINKMPRPRKYDYKVDKPTKMQLNLMLPVWAVEALQDEIGYKDLSKEVENFLLEKAQKIRKKD